MNHCDATIADKTNGLMTAELQNSHRNIMIALALFIYSINTSCNFDNLIK